MENKILNEMVKDDNYTRTENGAVALKSTNDNLVDLFGTINAMRGQPADRVLAKFHAAYAEDADLATKLVFWSRNVRGGQGERETFRTILKDMAFRHPDVVKANLANIVHFGRWDDLYVLDGTPLEEDMYTFLANQFNADIENYRAGNLHDISLLAKWLKSVNAHSEKTNHLGRKTARAFGMTEREYRKTLSTLRGAISVVEKQMSAKEWSKINYSAVPSIAAKNYRNAFALHDTVRYSHFLGEVNSGKVSIKAATLYPYDLVRAYTHSGQHVYGGSNPTIEAQWNSLPDYVGDGVNMMVIADTSGSMCWNGKSVAPIDVALGLAFYFAQHNKGIFHDYFMNFSDESELIKVTDGTLYDNIRKFGELNWGGTTNLEAAFDKLLDAAVKAHAPQSDMPASLVVITDMEFNECTNVRDYSCTFRRTIEPTFLETMREKYERAGYTLPKIVFWNVNSRHDTYHGNAFDNNVQFISGASASSFRDLIRGRTLTGYELMTETLNNPIYDCVVLPSALK